jgi:predicted secreted Zn-dependent protease
MERQDSSDLSRKIMRTQRSPRAWIALALCSAACAPVTTGTPRPEPASGIEVTIDERFYEVEGVTPWELNLELRRNGPRDHEEERSWFGATDFTLRYRFDPRTEADGCRASAARVEVELVTTLPEWPDREAAPAPLRQDWDLFLSRLREHERGHQRIAILLGQELLRGVEKLHAPDCATLRAEARRLAMEFESAGDHQHRSWDQRTAHGLADGS